MSTKNLKITTCCEISLPTFCMFSTIYKELVCLHDLKTIYKKYVMASNTEVTVLSQKYI